MKKIRDEVNFRDLGGYKTKDGKVVKKGLIYRSGSLNYMNENEIAFLNELHLKRVVDYRSELETNNYPDPVIDGAIRIEKSMVLNEAGEPVDFSPRGMRRTGEAGQEQLQRLKNYYNKLPFKNAAIQTTFEELLKENVPLVFHCASGKDRTGLAAILILLLLGVSEEDAKEDYLLSNKYRKKILEKTLKDIDKASEPELHELMLMFDGVSENTFNIIISTIKNKYETFEEFFLEEYNIDEKKLKQLRNFYTE